MCSGVLSGRGFPLVIVLFSYRRNCRGFERSFSTKSIRGGGSAPRKRKPPEVLCFGASLRERPRHPPGVTFQIYQYYLPDTHIVSISFVPDATVFVTSHWLRLQYLTRQSIRLESGFSHFYWGRKSYRLAPFAP